MTPVYLYVHDLRSSGVVRNAIALATRLARDRPTTLVAGYDDGLFRPQAAAGPFEFVRLADVAGGPLPRVQAAFRLRAWLRARPAGVLMSMGNLGHRSVWMAAQGSQHRRIYRISNEVTRGRGLRTILRQRWARLLIADGERVALVGSALARTPLIAAAVADGVAVQIPNGVDCEHVRSLAAAPTPHPWLEDAVPVVLGIGRLRPQKDFGLLIEGVARARTTRRMRLVILGTGRESERQRLVDLADAKGLGEDFVLAGETDNVFAWLARAGVFCLSSRWEGSSMALLEALAAGAPVVAAREAGDAAQVLAGGRHGLVVDGRCPDALADALLRQLSDRRVLPGDRILDYGMSVEAYARLVDEVALAAVRDAMRPARDSRPRSAHAPVQR